MGHGRRLNEQRTPFCVLRHNSNSHISLTMFSDIGLSELLAVSLGWSFLWNISTKKFLCFLETEVFQLVIDSYCNCILRHHNIKQQLWGFWPPFLIWISPPAYSRSSVVGVIVMIAIADINHLDFRSYHNYKICASVNLTCYLF